MDILIPRPSAAQASHQRTTDDLALDLSAYAGLRLDVARSGGKTYTLTLKDDAATTAGAKWRQLGG